MKTGLLGTRTLTLGAAIGATLMGFPAGPAKAILACQTCGPLQLLPAGCEFTLANGPVVFSDVVGTGGGNTHTVTITQFTITLGPSNSFVISIAGTDRKNTAIPTTTNFSFFPTVSETNTTTTTTPILQETLGVEVECEADCAARVVWPNLRRAARALTGVERSRMI